MSRPSALLALFAASTLSACGAQVVEFPTGSDVVANRAPSVLSTIPLADAVDVALDSLVSVTFDEAMDPSSLSGTSVLLFDRGLPVAGAVTVAAGGLVATFTPDTPLAPGHDYVGRVTTEATDLAAAPLAGDYTWSFTTVTTSVPEAPTVVGTTPPALATLVATDSVVTATFSAVMDAATLESPGGGAFVVTRAPGDTSVGGVVNYAAQTATFTPDTPLLPDTEYVATITTGAKDAQGVALAAPYTWSWRTAPTADTEAPTVTSTLPINLASGVSRAVVVTATFSEAMAPQSMLSATITLAESLSGDAVVGTVSYDVQAWTIRFTPAVALRPEVEYVATVTTQATDVAGNGLAAEVAWGFTTAAALPPNVITTQPADMAVDVPSSTLVRATFSTPMDPATLGLQPPTFTVQESFSGQAVTGVVTYAGNVATFAPDAPLAVDTEYLATITTAATDLAGTPLGADFTWMWTTSSFADAGPPTVLETTPKDHAVEVAVDAPLTVLFSEPMDPATLTASSFALAETVSGATVLAKASYDLQNLVATLTPIAPLLPGTNYTVTVLDDARDLTGEGLVVPAVLGLPVPNPWTFDTALVVLPQPPLVVNLRGVVGFGVASQAGLTSTGVTVVNGDVALYPLGDCVDSTGNAGASQSCLFITYGSPTGLTVNGSIYWAGDPFDNGGTANSVTNDLHIAWVEGMNLVDTMPPIAGGEMGGKVFAPGVYHNATLGLAVGSSASLDAQNDPDAVFVFKVDSSFVDSGTLLLPTRIDLTNGAQARNVWFVAGLDVTVGSGTVWNGTILAGRTATVLDGATVLGRVLAGASGAGAITLTGAASPSLTTITVPE